MRVTLFTSNQPRHIHLTKTLAEIADEVYCVQECNTVFPGEVEDFFKKSDVMQRYFKGVVEAEKILFGEISFSQANVRTLSIKSGDLNRLSPGALGSALDADVFVVFGASYIKGWLIDFLVEKAALNIHMGISPFYRGSSCNFWALYDDNPGYVGATVHRLSKGLDSGEMFFHCMPRLQQGDNPFLFTMRSVDVAHKALVGRIESGEIFDMPSVAQDKTQEVRCSRNADFTDAVALEFLERKMDLSRADFAYPPLLNPYFS